MYDILFPNVQGTSSHVEALWMCMYWVWEALLKASVVSHFVSCSLKSKGRVFLLTDEMVKTLILKEVYDRKTIRLLNIGHLHWKEPVF